MTAAELKAFGVRKAYEQKVLQETDGHCCSDWDELPVSAWTLEYLCCVDYPKSRLGKFINWFVMLRHNLNWWWVVGRHGERVNELDK